MVSVLALSAVDRGFEHRSGQPKAYKIGIYCFSDLAHSIKEKERDNGIVSSCYSWLAVEVIGAPDVYPDYGDEKNTWAPYACCTPMEYIQVP
jgi:hypothetical protein